MSTLHNYTCFLGRQLQSFPCAKCTQSILPKLYEKHCLHHHDFNPKLCCVWCEGRVSWPSREKKNHVYHLMSCARQFLKFSAQPPLPPPDLQPAPPAVPYDLTPMDPKRCLFDHVFEPPPRPYDALCPLAQDPVPLLFQSDSLNQGVACVRTYLRLRDTSEWFHVMVRIVAYPAFVQALDPDHTRTLPFSCWCDGGQPTEAPLRQHRHFILVSNPPGYFQTWVKSIVFENRPRRNFRCLFSKPIESARHLVNTLGYLCKRSSQCEFTGENTKRPEKDNHFYLFEELPRDYRLPLVLQWPEGLDQLLHQENRNFKRSHLAQAPLFHHQGKWRIQIRDIPGIALGTVLPVARDFEPCDEVTDAFLHLGRHRKLYFKRNPDLLRMDPEAWLQRQAAKGNQFLHAVGNELWTPRPYHQTLLNDFKPFVERNRELEARIAQQEARIVQLEAKLAPMERERQRLEATEHENQRLRDHVHEQQVEIKHLRDQMDERQQIEIERLRSEVAELKKDNERLRTALPP